MISPRGVPAVPVLRAEMGVATRKSARTYENSKEVYNGMLAQLPIPVSFYMILVTCSLLDKLRWVILRRMILVPLGLPL